MGEDDPFEEVNEYWKKKVHERDLRETKWPRDVPDITLRWMNAFLKSEVEEFNMKRIGSTEISRIFRVKARQKGLKPASFVIEFSNGDDANDQLWRKAYRNLVVFRQEFANSNPTSPHTIAAKYNPQQPLKFCTISEDVLVDENILQFPDWATTGMNAHFAHMMYDSLAKTHGAFFAHAGVEKGLLVAGGFVADSRFSPAYTDAISAFFDASAVVDDMVVDDAHHGLPIRDIYSSLAAKPLQHPIPSLFGAHGREIVAECFRRCGRRPLTLCHGELHAGHSFMDVRTNEFTFAGWRLVSAAPPGTDLAVGLLTALQPCTKQQIKGIVQHYYASLVASGADEDAYPFEHCWEDFLLGCILWCCTYPAFEVARLLTGPATVAGDAEFYLPRVYNRMVRNATELDLDSFALSLLPTSTPSPRAAARSRQPNKPTSAPLKPAPKAGKVKVQVPFT